MFNIGILGLGKIARKMASTVNDMDGVNLYAVSSRSAEKAEAFRKDFNADKAYAGYDSLLQDEKVDLVYIATPHPQHLDMMLQCIKYKKPVLCEKAFTLNTEQAKKVFEQAEKNKVFVAEAIWTRYILDSRDS